MTKDYERLAETSETFVYVAISRLMVRRLARSGDPSDSFVRSSMSKARACNRYTSPTSISGSSPSVAEKRTFRVL